MTTGFVRFIPGAEDLVRAVLLPGAAAVRVSDDAAGAGVGVAGDYAGVALAVWVASDQGACVLVNRGLALAWHPDLLGDGQPALVAAVADGLGDFVVARFPVDLRPPHAGRVVRRVEAEYLLGTIRLWVDGAEVTAGATGGSAETIGADAGVLSLGGAVGGSVVRSAALAGYTTAAGAASKWTANTGGDVVDAVSGGGGVGWFMVERSAGVPIVWARFDDALYDEVDAGLSASPNDPTHGFAWVGSGSPQFGGMMADSAMVEYNGGVLRLLVDAPLDGGSPITLDGTAVVDESKVGEVVLAITGDREIAGKFLEYKPEYPKVTGGNQMEIWVALDYPWAPDRVHVNTPDGDLLVRIPAGLVTQGGFSSAANAAVPVTNDSFFADDQHDRIGDSHQIVFVAHATGTDPVNPASPGPTEATVYTKATLPNPGNTRYPGAVRAFATVPAALAAVRGTTVTTANRERKYAMLFRGPETITSFNGKGLTDNRTYCPYATRRLEPVVLESYDCEPGDEVLIDWTGQTGMSLHSGKGWGIAIGHGFRVLECEHLFKYVLGAPITTIPQNVQDYIFWGRCRANRASNRGIFINRPSTVADSWRMEKLLCFQPVIDEYADDGGTSNPSGVSVDSAVLPTSGGPCVGPFEMNRTCFGIHLGAYTSFRHVHYVKGPGERHRYHGVTAANARANGAPKSDGMQRASYRFGLIGDCEGLGESSVNMEVNSGEAGTWGTRTDRSDAGPNAAGRNSYRNFLGHWIMMGSSGVQFQSSYEDLLENLLLRGAASENAGGPSNAINPGAGSGSPNECGEGRRSVLRKFLVFLIGQGTGIQINPPDSDVPTENGSIGHHDAEYKDGIITGTGMTRAVRVLDHLYATRKSEGAISVRLRNLTIHDPTGLTGKFIDRDRVSPVTYNTIAAFAAATDDLMDGSSDSDDPQLFDPTRTFATYAALLGYADEEAMWAAHRDGVWTQNMPAGLREDQIARYIVTGYRPQNAAVLAAGRAVDFWAPESEDPDPTPAARATGSARGRGAIRTRKGVAMHAGRGR